jgi:two-component system, cell cycle response regulator
MRMLIADDDRVTLKLLEAQLTKWGHDLVLCHDGGEAWDTLQGQDAPKMAILDWIMPTMSGPEICRRLRSLQSQAYIYIILLTSRKGKEDVVTGLEAGADDYIVKPFDLNELRVRIRAGVRMVELQDKLRSALAVADFRASHDPLTGLWNRGAIMDILNKEMDRGNRQGSATGVILADIDHFKLINDEHGHLAGDDVLKLFSAKMGSVVRPYDAVGRYGGEEFIVVLPDCGAEEAGRVAERMRRVMEEDALDSREGSIRVTISLGVASVVGGNENTDDLIRRADEALYRAKNRGRNRVEMAESAGVEKGAVG